MTFRAKGSPVFVGSLALCLAGVTVAVAVTEAEPAFDQRNGQPLVSFRMTEESKRGFAAFTTRNVGQKAEFRLDGQRVMAPVIREPITGGTGQIVAEGLDVEQAKRIAERLVSGTVTFEVEIVTP